MSQRTPPIINAEYKLLSTTSEGDTNDAISQVAVQPQQHSISALQHQHQQLQSQPQPFHPSQMEERGAKRTGNHRNSDDDANSAENGESEGDESDMDEEEDEEDEFIRHSKHGIPLQPLSKSLLSKKKKKKKTTNKKRDTHHHFSIDMSRQSSTTPSSEEFSMKGRNRTYNLSNLDRFFHRMFQYRHGNGIYCILLTKILNLFTLAFVICFAIFLLAAVDYTVLFDTYDLKKAVDLHELLELHPILVLVFTIFSIYWGFQLISLFTQIAPLLEMKAFYEQELEIPERDISTIAWPEIIRRLELVQKKKRISKTQNSITALDVANRIMRKDNYLIAMINMNILNLEFDVPFLGKRKFMSKLLEWTIRTCILHWNFDPRFSGIKDEFLDPTKAEALARSLQVRFFLFGLVFLILSPVIAVLLVAYYFFRYTEEFRSQPNLLGAREWTPYARWYIREFNELDNIFEMRLNQSYKASNKYISKFNSEIIAQLARFVSFFAGAFAAVITVLALYDDQFLLEVQIIDGRSMLWFLGICGVILAVTRSLIPDDHLVFEPKIAMKEVTRHIHIAPWNGREHTFEARDEFGQLFELRVVMFIQEIVSLLLNPIILWFKLAGNARAIVDFFRNYTTEYEGVGRICSFSAFDFAAHGNPLYGVPIQGYAAHTKFGKMEQSFVSFKAVYQDWEMSTQAKEFYNRFRFFGSLAANSLPKSPLTSIYFGKNGTGSLPIGKTSSDLATSMRDSTKTISDATVELAPSDNVMVSIPQMKTADSMGSSGIFGASQMSNDQLSESFTEYMSNNSDFEPDNQGSGSNMYSSLESSALLLSKIHDYLGSQHMN